MLGTAILLLLVSSRNEAAAQNQPPPLTVEGIHQTSTHSAASVGTGGTTLLVRDNAASMFHNPAMLTTLSGIQVSVGGVHRSVTRSQVQHYAPVRYYPNLSLLLEGLAHLIQDPDPDLIGFTPADSVQRSFDDIGPNWDTSESNSAPLQAFAAMPMDFGDIRIAAGLGVAEYGNFDYYYQNNNVISPDVLSQRPLPAPRPTDDNPVVVDWYQALRSRQGAVTGYGGALALELKEYGAAFGVSATYLHGSTQDIEQDLARGQLTFFSNYFRADSAQGQISRRGQSEFTGLDVALSTTLSSEYVTAGVTVRPPLTITRSFTMDVISDAPGGSTGVVAGEDRMQLPWRGSLGIALRPRDNLTLGLEYEMRPYGSARFTDAEGNENYPWMSSSAFRAGGEYALLPWLALRGGLRREAETYGAEGRPVEDEAVWFMAYSAGAGFSFAGLQLNLAYENRGTLYQDILGSAVYHNRDRRHFVVADLIYTFDWPY